MSRACRATLGVALIFCLVPGCWHTRKNDDDFALSLEPDEDKPEQNKRSSYKSRRASKDSHDVGPKDDSADESTSVSRSGPPPAPVQRPAVVLALESLMRNERDDAINQLAAYDPKDQELLLRLLPVIAALPRGGLLTSQMTGEELLNLLEALRGGVTEIQTRAPLVIDKLIFCEEVICYGRVKQSQGNRFKPGEPVLLYAELQNLSDRRVREDFYVARLSSRLELRDQHNKVIWSLSPQSKPDWSQSPRNDHFGTIRFYLPQDLPPGNYTVRVLIRDEDTGRDAEKIVPLQVANLTPGGRGATSENRPMSDQSP